MIYIELAESTIQAVIFQRQAGERDTCSRLAQQTPIQSALIRSPPVEF